MWFIDARFKAKETGRVTEEITATELMRERERCAKIAALFVHRRLYEPNFPACSYHSREIYEAVMTISEEELLSYDSKPKKEDL